MELGAATKPVLTGVCKKLILDWLGASSRVAPRFVFQAEMYREAVENWPQRGQHILAQFTDSAILVFQAFNEDIGRHAIEHQSFAGCPQFSCTRMTW